MELKPMLLTEVWSKSVLEDSTKMFQVKENGVRAILHVKQGKIVGIRNRSNLPILYCFPELKEVKLPYDSAILDAEIVVMQNGKSAFYGGVDKRRSAPTATTLQKHPATAVVFDALAINGESLLSKPYKARYAKLSTIGQTDFIKVAQNFDAKSLWARVVSENLEGVVIKDPNAYYEVDTRSKQMLKLKNYKLTVVSVTSSEQNDKGTKIFGKSTIDGKEIIVEAQLAGIFGVESGTTQIIKYLDVQGSRLIQPTKVNREQIETLEE